jgi:hypothetical protein
MIIFYFLKQKKKVKTYESVQDNRSRARKLFTIRT